MSRPKGSKTVYFSKVKEVRDKIAADALELYDMYKDMIRDAIAAQDFETANKGLQFLMEHMPRDEEGFGVIDSSVDNVKRIEGAKAPTIQIGIALGNNSNTKALPPQVIDIEPDDA